MKNQQQVLIGLLNRTNRNGLLDFIKNTLPMRSNTLQLKYHTTYKNKAHNHYAKQIQKPFKLIDQPQYHRQLKFAQNFNSYMETTKNFEQIRQKTPSVIQSLENKITRETFNNFITIDPKIAKKHKSSFNHMYTNKSLDNVKPLTPFKTIELAAIKKQNNQKQDSKNLSSNEKNIPISISLKRKATNIGEIVVNKQQIITKAVKDVKDLSSKPIPKWNINQELMLDRLNSINGTSEKKHNFRIEKAKIHRILQQKYGNQVFTNFFMMQNKQKFQGILYMIKQLATFSTVHLQLFTFLTYDVNEDGIICENDLLSITRSISINSIINEDINKISKYAIQKKIGDNAVDLPIQFINMPTFRTLRKMRDQNNSFSPTSSKYVPVVKRFFSTKFFDSNEIQSKVVNLPKTKNNTKKIQINFEIFQNIFNKSIPKFIPDFVYFLTRTKIGNIEINQQLKKIVINEQKKGQVTNYSIEDKIGKKMQKAYKYLQQYQNLNNTLNNFSII